MTQNDYRFCAAEYLPSWDERQPQQAFYELAGAAEYIRPDGMPVIASRDDILALCRHPAVHTTDGTHFNLGGQRPLIPLDLDGDTHRKYRKLLDPLFTPKQMAKLEPAVRRLTNELIDGFVHNRQVELYEALCVPLPSRIFISLLGLPLEDLPVFVGFKEAVVRPEGDTFQDQEASRAKAGERMYAYLADTLAKRRRGPCRDDLLSGFIETEIDGDRLTDDEIIDICYLLVIAGLDTVTSSLSCQFAWFAQHPEQRRHVIDNPELMSAAVEELQRFESPVPLGHRYVSDDIEMAGRSFARGTRVQVLWAAANVDPQAFPDPLTVDLARRHNAHVGFAIGPHRCLGSNLARMELRTVIAEFHRRIPDYWVTPTDEIAYTNFGVRGAIHLPLSFPVGG